MFEYNFLIAELGVGLSSAIELNTGFLDVFAADKSDTRGEYIRYEIKSGKIPDENENGGFVIKDERSGKSAVLREKIPGGYIITVGEDYISCFGYGLLMDSLNIPSELMTRGALTLHASFVALDGKAVLFTAPSGGGKSTQAALWKNEFGAEIINGDRAVIKRKGGRIFAFGTPYCGTSGICGNGSFPLAAVIVTAKAGTDSIRRCSAAEAAAAIYSGVPAELTKGIHASPFIDALADISGTVPFYRLECLPRGGAAFLARDAVL